MLIDPELPAGSSTPHPQRPSPHQFIYLGLWYLTSEMFQVVQYPELPGLYILKLPQIQDFRQVLLEMDDYVIVMDAPPEQAPAVVDWARKNLGKPIGQVWPTHHHHDHAFGVKTYSQAGATVVVPEMAKEYYSNIPGIKFETYM
ncbi:predicted protein [Plenodomus lingam JN3]|uniref:Predicted protein n=1 Tax=Leptosphaeria maculans (strain JN3 / isolate v23.1.3 / race Av1-4-5-6-7-8) TaxID=985895 RepID=E4ZWP8_LEPMJ|nr:predicted protein [Plenodomus lingam JN3]CBX96024.1 predicted protein [Plenodomus lingam JN3]